MERHPPFGQIPGPLFGQHRLSSRTADTVLALDSFRACPSGLLASLRTVTRDPELFDVPYSFEPLEEGRPCQLDVWARFADPSTVGNVVIPAHLASGSRGQDGGVESRHFDLWFPIQTQEVQDGVTVAISWPEASIRSGTVVLPAADLKLAAVLSMAF